MNDPMPGINGRSLSTGFRLALVIGAIGIGTLALWLTPIIRHHLAVDRCLDAGGVYDHQQGWCILPT